jgi:hypothetical protein
MCPRAPPATGPGKRPDPEQTPFFHDTEIDNFHSRSHFALRHRAPRWRKLIAGATLWTTSGENPETKNRGAVEKLETGPFPITTRLF